MHAMFSPSQLARIIACPGSVSLYDSVRPVGVESSYAREGTMLHEYMEQLVKDKIELQDIPDPEHRAACRDAWDYISPFLHNAQVLTETKVAVRGIDGLSGTADVIAVSNDSIDLFDYKFGANVLVDIHDNAQFMAYMLGAIDTLKLDTTKRLLIHVIQPRMLHYQCVEITYDKLLTWKNMIVIPAIANAKSDNPRFNPSEETCRWCQCKAVCRACYIQAQEAAKSVFAAYSQAKNNAALTQEELMAFYKDLPILESQIKATKEYILAELLRGHKMPGYKVVYGRANRKWRDEALAAKYLMEKYELDPDDMYETKFRSPAQIEKICKEVKKDEEFSTFIEVPQGQPKVVAEDDETEMPNPFSSVTEKKV